MSEAQVTYVITEQHMCTLAQLAHHGRLETCLGRARFLKAICPLVWPNLKLELEFLPPTEPNAPEPPVLVRAYRMDQTVYSDNLNRFARGDMPSSEPLWRPVKGEDV